MMILLLAGAARATPTPIPGPGCAGKLPIANQSSNPPDCPRSLLVHNASCGTAAVPSGNNSASTHRPQFHTGSKCHGENDPNGPFYYNGTYHLFFQDHVDGGVVGGHLASRDLVHWRHLSVGLWNDRWYDKGSVYTFSATIVDGKPILLYPGIAWPNSSLGKCGQNCFAHAVAMPANLSDPWLEDWVKPEYNPVVLNTQRDPSTAWQTSRGEWRYTWYSGGIYSSWDFVNFVNVGNLFGKNECPDFFPLPAACDGCGTGSSIDNETRPTHVHATAGYQLGIYDEGAPNSTGHWTPIAGASGHMDGSGSTFFYASKSFWDPVKERRIVWGWVRVGLGSLSTTAASDASAARDHSKPVCRGVTGARVMMNSLAREVRWDPYFNRLTFFPVDEMEQLRGNVVATEPAGLLRGERPLKLAPGLGSQSELRASFAMPTSAVRFGVRVMTGGPIPNASAELFIDCKNATGCVSGFAINNANRVPASGEALSLPLKRGIDSSIDIAVWTDHTVIEFFVMSGRGYWTVPLSCDSLTNNTAQGISVFAEDGTNMLKNLTVWSVNSIWTEDADCGDNCS